MDAFFNNMRPDGGAGSYSMVADQGASLPDSLDQAYTQGALTGDQFALLSPLISGQAALSASQADSLWRAFPQIQYNLSKSPLPGRITISPNYSVGDYASKTGTPQLSDQEIASTDAQSRADVGNAAMAGAGEIGKVLGKFASEFFNALGKVNLLGKDVPVVAVGLVGLVAVYAIARSL